MDFKDKVAVVTGGVSGIGKAISKAFIDKGANVCVIDLLDNSYFQGDIADKVTLEKFSQKVIQDYGKIDFLINNAMISKGGIDTCSYEDFNYSLKVGVLAPYYLTKLFSNNFAKGGSIVNISSTRDSMSQPYTESYTAAKGGIHALTHALAISLGGIVRVNSISPGWIDENNLSYYGADANQHPVKRVGNPLDIANMVLYLCSEEAGFITGENISIDGGMSKLMIYHNDYGWNLKG